MAADIRVGSLAASGMAPVGRGGDTDPEPGIPGTGPCGATIGAASGIPGRETVSPLSGRIGKSASRPVSGEDVTDLTGRGAKLGDATFPQSIASTGASGGKLTGIGGDTAKSPCADADPDAGVTVPLSPATNATFPGADGVPFAAAPSGSEPTSATEASRSLSPRAVTSAPIPSDPTLPTAAKPSSGCGGGGTHRATAAVGPPASAMTGTRLSPAPSAGTPDLIAQASTERAASAPGTSRSAAGQTAPATTPALAQSDARVCTGKRHASSDRSPPPLSTSSPKANAKPPSGIASSSSSPPDGRNDTGLMARTLCMVPRLLPQLPRLCRAEVTHSLPPSRIVAKNPTDPGDRHGHPARRRPTALAPRPADV